MCECMCVCVCVEEEKTHMHTMRLHTYSILCNCKIKGGWGGAGRMRGSKGGRERRVIFFFNPRLYFGGKTGQSILTDESLSLII